MADRGEHKHQYFLAAVPVVAYFCILAYEAGRFSYLGISPEYLELTIQRIAQLGLITLLAILALGALLTFLIALAESSSEHWSLFGRILLWTVPLVLFTALLAPGWMQFVMAIGIGLVKATDNLSPRENDAGKSHARRRLDTLRNDLLWAILLIGFTSVLFYRVGELVQQFDETALVIGQKPTSIVVGSYAGSLLIKDYNPKTRQLSNSFRLESIDGVSIVEKRVGRLRRQPPNNSFKPKPLRGSA